MMKIAHMVFGLRIHIVGNTTLSGISICLEIFKEVLCMKFNGREALQADMECVPHLIKENKDEPICREEEKELVPIMQTWNVPRK